MTEISNSRHGPPPELITQARAYVASKEWTFAKTMPENPHHYVVFPFGEEGAERDGYLALQELITKHGWKRRWHGRRWQTYRLDDHDYWHMQPVINRKPSAEAGWED